MTVSSTVSVFRQAGNGVTVSFAYTSRFNSQSDLVVSLYDVATGITTPQILNTNYTITGTVTNGKYLSGGQVVFSIAPPAGKIVVLQRILPLTQSSDYGIADPFEPDTLENDLDYGIMVSQQIAEESSRAIKSNVASSLTDITLPPPSALQLIGWNATADALVNSAPVVGPTGPTGPAGAGVYRGVATGTANAQIITCTPTLTSLNDLIGSILIVSPSATNTSSALTFNIDGLGVNTVRKHFSAGDVSVAVGDNYIARPTEYTYNGTNIIMLTPPFDSKGATLASASTLNLGAATGNYVQVSGSVTINAITLAEGKSCKVKFDATPTLVNSASLILKSGSNIVCAAGDTAEFVGEAAGVVRQLTHDRADGTALVSSSSSGGWLADTANFWYQYDDFIGKATGNYSNTVSGAGAAFTLSGSTGYITAASGTTSTGRCVISGTNMPATNAANSKLTGSELAFAATVSVLSNGTDRYSLYLGKHDGTGAAEPSNGIYFRYIDNVNSGRWQCVCRSSGVETVINCATAVPTQNVYLGQQFRWVGLSASSVEFFIDGVSQGTISSNIPGLLASGPIWDFAIGKALGTTSINVNVTAIKTIRAKT